LSNQAWLGYNSAMNFADLGSKQALLDFVKLSGAATLPILGASIGGPMGFLVGHTATQDRENMLRNTLAGTAIGAGTLGGAGLALEKYPWHAKGQAHPREILGLAKRLLKNFVTRG